jgi:hypothetical protein
MAKRKNKKNVSTVKKMHTVDSLTKVVRDMSTNRKHEIEDNPDLTTMICSLADYGGDMLMNLLDEAILTDDADVKKKDKLLVLQLLYLKLCSQILGQDNIDLNSSIPISGYTGAKPIDTSKENVPIYL